MLKIILIIFVFAFYAVGCKKALTLSSENSQVENKTASTSDPWGATEPREYNPFSYTKDGIKISAKVVAELPNSDRRIVIFNPAIENSSESLKEASFNAMKNWQPRKCDAKTFGEVRQEADSSGSLATCWNVENKDRWFCSLPNPPDKDRTINVIRVWWK